MDKCIQVLWFCKKINMIVMRTQISIIPYNSEATLEDTLKSVIDQDYQDWEVIVNDGSIDTTEEIALKW
jgi:cellulose synthase/poly-beta-1,6-N-acetylglucosamine synthase-like glycosyltransferase